MLFAITGILPDLHLSEVEHTELVRMLKLLGWGETLYREPNQVFTDDENHCSPEYTLTIYLFYTFMTQGIH